MRKILVTWVARNNDPYEWDSKNASIVVDNDGNKVFGPTLTLLLDPESPYSSMNSAYVFYRSESDLKALNGVRDILREQRPKFKLEARAWTGSDPTDHKELFRYLKDEMRGIREIHPEDELVISISPGTPAMHTVWVLLAETGCINNPVTLVQCHRKNERKGRVPVEKVFIGIENYLKLYQDTIRRFDKKPESGISWNPLDFRSEKLKALEREARRFARLKIPVLILGERGTGKSTWAVWIRSNSPFNQLKEKWNGVACGQFTSDLMRSELFGHEGGAFTGAIRKKYGLLKRMDKDTLFLDEIGDIDRGTQRLLIKALEEKEFQPLGSEVSVKSDFRLITATNRSLDELRKRMDEDFFDRISPLILNVPPLREIPEDIPRIWQEVYSQALILAEVDLRKIVFSKESHSKVVKYLQNDTPVYGNYRDLYCVAYRLIAYLNDPEVSGNIDDAVSYGLSALQQNNNELPAAGYFALPSLAPGFSLETYLSGTRRRLILQALKMSSDKQSKAARLLGITPQAINNFLKEQVL